MIDLTFVRDSLVDDFQILVPILTIIAAVIIVFVISWRLRND